MLQCSGLIFISMKGNSIFGKGFLRGLKKPRLGMIHENKVQNNEIILCKILTGYLKTS